MAEKLTLKKAGASVHVFKHAGNTPVMRKVWLDGKLEYEPITDKHACVIRPYRDKHGLMRGEMMIVRKENLHAHG